MYSKEEVKELKLSFWNHLEEQLKKQKNPFGTKVNWMNYGTGFKDLYFRMEADESGVRLCIDLQFKDEGVREVFYEQFEEFKNILEENFKDLIWHKDFIHANGKTISRICIEKTGVNIYNRKDWDKMHLFLKVNFKKLDEFWNDFKDVFVALK